MLERRETNWFILSGPPEYGTRLLAASLSRRPPLTVIQDSHILYEGFGIETRRKLGLSNPYRMQLGMLRDQLELERGGLSHESLVVFNLGIGDYLFRVGSETPRASAVRDEDQALIEEAGSHALATRYRQIFILPRPIEGLSIPGGTTRTVSAHFPRQLEEFYKEGLGYQPIMVDDTSSLAGAAKFVVSRIGAYMRS